MKFAPRAYLAVAALVAPFSMARAGIIQSSTGVVIAGPRWFVGTQGEDGSLEINGGEHVEIGWLQVAQRPGESGHVLIRDPGTSVDFTGTGESLHLETVAGTSTVTISNGATAQVKIDRTECAPTWCISSFGQFAGANTTFTVTDPGSSFSSINNFIVGGDSVDAFTGLAGGTTVATVNVLNGGHLRTENALIGFSFEGLEQIGTERVFATVNIAGVGSVWDVESSHGTPSVRLGNDKNTSASINITNGGTMRIVSGTSDQIAQFVVGNNESSASNSITIDGPGSLLRVENEVFGVSRIAAGTVDVINGGLLQQINTGILIGGGGSLATLHIDEASRAAANVVLVGPQGQPGTGLLILDGSLGGNVIVDNNGILSGNGTIEGNLSNIGGLIAPGFSPGLLTVEGDLTVTDGGIIEIEMAGLSIGEFDQLSVGGVADLTGANILFSFIESFLPRSGDIIDFILADSLTGLDMATFSFTGLQPSFQFDVYQAGSGLRFMAQSDGVSVPEPKSFALLLAGLGLIALRLVRISRGMPAAGSVRAS